MIVKECLEVKEIDKIPKDNKKPSIKILNKIFSKVSRIYAKSELSKVELVLDINSELLVLKEGDKVEILIEESPFDNEKNKDTKKDMFIFENLDDMDFMKNYEYVMHGVIFHSGFEEGRVFIYASFGGLLMKYFGFTDYMPIDSIKLDKKILLMIKKFPN